MDEQVTSATVVDINLHFREQSGSVTPYRHKTTLGELGIQVDQDALPLRPTTAEVEEALATDAAFPNTAPNEKAWVKLAAKYTAKAQQQAHPVAQRLRAAVLDFLKSDGIPGHPIDRARYTWDGGDNSLTISGVTDDAIGSLTGTPNAFFYNIAGAAVWGE